MLPVAIKVRMCLGSLHFRRIFVRQEVIFILLYIFLHTPPSHFGEMDKRQIWGGWGGGAISKLANVFNSCQVGKRQGNGGGGGGGGVWVILKNIS